MPLHFTVKHQPRLRLASHLSPPLSFSLVVPLSLPPFSLYLSHVLSRLNTRPLVDLHPPVVQPAHTPSSTTQRSPKHVALARRQPRHRCLVSRPHVGRSKKLGVDPPSLTGCGGCSWSHEVPLDPLVVTVPLVHDESGQNAKLTFRDKLSKL